MQRFLLRKRLRVRERCISQRNHSTVVNAAP